MKKVLIITYYWFPYYGTGTYRVSKIVKYLKKMGWEPIILTPNINALNYTVKKLDPVYEDIKVYHTKIFEPTSLFKKNKKEINVISNSSIFLSDNLSLKQKIFRWIRVNFFIPDAKLFWQFYAVKKGKYVIKKEKPDIIFSTSPPPTTNLIARKLAKWSKLNWVADFRDPWTNIYYYEKLNISGISKKLNKNLEKKVLRDANKIITVSENFFPDSNINNKSFQIENGFDLDDFQYIEPPQSKNKKYTIRYIGTLKSNQFFENFLKILKELSTNKEFQSHIKFETIGFLDEDIKNYIKKELANIEVNIIGYVAHKEAIEYMASADLLIMAIGKGVQSKNVVSTKIFEYLMAGKPILAFGHTDGIANRILTETNGGKMFEYDAYESVKQYFLSNYNNWQNNNNGKKINQEELKKYNFFNLTQKIAAVMDSCLSNKN